MMKSLLTVTVIALMLAFASASWASYTIDADLSDWGVFPLGDLIPSSLTAEYETTDNINKYNADSYSESFDFEAMYFDDDEDYIYIAIISSTDLSNGDYNTGAGSLGIHLGSALDITPHGVVNTTLEYAIGPHEVTQGNLLADPAWVDTHRYEWPGEGQQNTPWWAEGGTDLGSVSPVHVRVDLEAGIYGEDTSILELAIPKSLLPFLAIGTEVGLHISVWCGNDGINLLGTIDFGPPPPPRVPAPSAILLSSIGVGLVDSLRRRKIF